MDTRAQAQELLVEMLIQLAATLKPKDLEDPDTYALCQQLVTILDPKPAPLPQELIDMLAPIQDKKELFVQAAQLLGLSDHADLHRLADSLKAAGLLSYAGSMSSQPSPASFEGPKDGTEEEGDEDEDQEEPEHMKKALFEDGNPNFHGWISPAGKWHPLGEDEYHSEALAQHLKKPEASTASGVKKGWIAVGHGGYNNVRASQKVMLDRTHPAHKTLRKLMRDHLHDESFSFHPNDIEQVPEYDTHHFIKHGTLKENGFRESIWKSINGNWKDDPKYRFENYEFSYGAGRSVRVYHGRKRVGHLAFSSNPRKDGYHEVFNSNIDEAHRGKGLYQEMIRQAGDVSVKNGGKGVKSEGYQRSGDATRVWDKLATHAEPWTNNAKVQGHLSQHESNYFYTPSLVQKCEEILEKMDIKSILARDWYHGTSTDAEHLRPSRTGAHGPGVYFTSHAEEASGYAHVRNSGKGGNVRVAKIHVNNPYFVGHEENIYDKLGVTGKTSEEADANLHSKLRSMGHDSILAEMDDTRAGMIFKLPPSELHGKRYHLIPLDTGAIKNKFSKSEITDNLSKLLKSVESLRGKK